MSPPPVLEWVTPYLRWSKRGNTAKTLVIAVEWVDTAKKKSDGSGNQPAMAINHMFDVGRFRENKECIGNRWAQSDLRRTDRMSQRIRSARA